MKLENFRSAAVCIFILTLPGAGWARWHGGIGVNGEVREVRTTDFDSDLASVNSDPNFSNQSGRVSGDGLNESFNLFVEKDIIDNFRIGLSAGVERAAGINFNSSLIDVGPVGTLAFGSPGYAINRTANLDTLEVPISIYLKNVRPNRKLAFWVGAGASYLDSSVNYNRSTQCVVPAACLGFPATTADIGTFDSSGWAPHIVFGSEYFITQSVSFDLDFRYLFDAVLSNYTGNLTTAGNSVTTQNSILVMAPAPGGGSGLWAHDASFGLLAGERRFQQDFGGIRFNFGLRYYFGEAN